MTRSTTNPAAKVDGQATSRQEGVGHTPGLTRSITIDDLTPEEMAYLFCEMDSRGQARFFTRVGEMAANWSGAGWCQQSCAISQHLDKTATETIIKLGEWAADPYVSDHARARGEA